MKKNKIILTLLTTLLFFIPFFWFRPGEADLGGDSSRLYFFDPIAYLHSQPLYGITTSGIGGESISYFGIPYVLLIALVKYFVESPALVINIFQGLALSVAFLSCYLIIKDFAFLTNKHNKYTEVAAMLGGLYYVFSPTLILGWDKAILTHNQFFLNPLMFFLFLRFLSRDNIKYLLAALLISFIFAPNFSFIAAPAFFAFYPLAIAFLILFILIILKKPLPVRKILLGFVLFFLVHLFHLGPHIIGLFTGGSEINNAVFSSEAKYTRGLSYFTAVATSVKASISLMSLPQMTALVTVSLGFIIFPLILLLGFLWNKSRLYLLTGIFFLIALFFVTANITTLGFQFYKSLFEIPGFSMFRNYFGQWAYVFSFFYVLLFGQALQIVFQKVRPQYAYFLSGLVVLFVVSNAWPFINGSLLNKIHYQSKNVKITSEIDPEYEKVLKYIRALPTDGKFISFPLSGPGYQTLAGKNGGAYQGPSTITYLTGKNDFTGYDGLTPFNETFLELVKNNDITGINRLFSILSIKYVFYNSDPNIYDETFPKYPYDHVRSIMPKDQVAYKAFLMKLPISKVKSFGDNYHIYEVTNYLPHMYVADNALYASDALTPYFVLDLDESMRSVVYTPNETLQKDKGVILEAKNTNPLLELLNNYHLHVHNPFISRRMDDVFYPLVDWREKRTLLAKSENPVDYIDYSLLFLSKRVAELEKYTDTPVTHKKFNQPPLWQINRWKEYNSWEASLTRYEKDMGTLINWIKTSDSPESTKNAMKVKVNGNLSQQELSFMRIINQSSNEKKDKKYLHTLTKKVFANLYEQLDLQPLSTSKIVYSLTLPNDAALGNYNVYLKSQKDELLNPKLFTININNTIVSPLKTDTQTVLLKFNKVTVLNKETNIVLKYFPTNLLETSRWSGTGQVQESGEKTTLMIDNILEGGGVFSRKVENFKPDTQYIITFDYNTKGDDYIFKFYQKELQNKTFKSSTTLHKYLSSTSWRTHQSVITSTNISYAGYLQLLSNSEKERGEIQVRNASVVEVPNDTLLFEKDIALVPDRDLPTIKFSKINPTKYRVQVTNATQPYNLVFSESYNNKWKVYVEDFREDNSAVTASYFNGQIKEGKHSNTFFNNSFLTQNLGGPIAEERHTQGNGYANVWNITPEDVKGKQNYTLHIEYAPQRNLYIFLGISLMTVLGLLFYIVLYRGKK